MTEAEWLTATDPLPMLNYLRNSGSERKFHLIMAALCRRIWSVLARESQEEVELHEKLADQPDCHEAKQALQRDIEIHIVEELIALTRYATIHSDEFPEEGLLQHTLTQEIFGNPFRPVTFNPSWRTSTALALAIGIYHEKAFDRLPILADALQDVCCVNDDILDHLRQPGEHCRGCWALDLVLGKE